MKQISRRDALKAAGLVAAAAPLGSLLASPRQTPEKGSSVHLNLGMASYTFRAFSLDQAIAMTQRLGLPGLTLKEMHLPLKSSDQEIAASVKKIRDAGLALTGLGVIYMTTEEEVRRAFAYAAAAGCPMIVGVAQGALLDLAEQKVKETGIALALHNHGPSDPRYPTPETAYKAAEGRDRRIGLCVDVGHTQRSGLDPAAEIERYFDRVLDVHIKDVTASEKAGTTVEIGRGVIDIPKLLATLGRLGYKRILHCEFEKDQKDPLAGIAESVGYLRGVLRTLA